MTEHLYVTEGHPFTGYEKERLVQFLEERGLSYDPDITDTIAIVDETTERVVATGSLSGIILKCVAVAEEYHGQGLLSEVMSRQYEILGARGITHFIGFTKPQNAGVFSHMGLHEVLRTEHIIFLENRNGGFQHYLKENVEILRNDVDRFPPEEREMKTRELGEALYQKLWEESAHIGEPETTRLAGYLIRREQIPTYFIKDRAHADTFCAELENKLKDVVRDALFQNRV